MALPVSVTLDTSLHDAAPRKDNYGCQNCRISNTFPVGIMPVLIMHDLPRIRHLPMQSGSPFSRTHFPAVPTCVLLQYMTLELSGQPHSMRGRKDRKITNGKLDPKRQRAEATPVQWGYCQRSVRQILEFR